MFNGARLLTLSWLIGDGKAGDPTRLGNHGFSRHVQFPVDPFDPEAPKPKAAGHQAVPMGRLG